MNAVTAIIELFLKLALLLAVAAGLSSAMLIFGPTSTNQRLGADDFYAAHAGPIGVVFLGSWLYLVAHFVFWLYPKIRCHIERWTAHRVLERDLQALTAEERGYLQRYFGRVEEIRSTSLRRMESSAPCTRTRRPSPSPASSSTSCSAL